MPRRSLDNAMVVPVLGLLLEQPMHPYQMLSELRKRNENQAAAVHRGSLYNLVEALAGAGWLAPSEKERDGNRPERTVYTVTPAGFAELRRRLDVQIRTPEREFTRFLGAVAYLGALGPEGAEDALRERSARLRERTAADESRLAEAHEAGAPRLFVIEAEYALALARAEADWIDSLIADIRSGALPWPKTVPGPAAGEGAPGDPA